MSQHVSILLLGSNLGNPKENLKTALLEIEASGCTILQKTNFLTSIPVEFVSSNNFCNIATRISMSFSPIQLLKTVKNIERKMGRDLDSTAGNGYTDRIIDIDIVTFDALHYHSSTLSIPHPKHRNEREFSKQLLIELETLHKKQII